MTTDPVYQRLLETSWRRPLTAAEMAELGAWLESHPEWRADWQAEAGLGNVLSSLRDLPVPSNFTARVMQAIEREEAAEIARPSGWRLIWKHLSQWAPRTAAAGLIVGAGSLAYVHHARIVERRELVQSVEVVSDVRSLPGPQVLEDFDAIRVS